MSQVTEESYIEPMTVHKITCSLEPLKSNFFKNQLQDFIAELNKNQFRVFVADYKYASDYDGKPQFIVNNLLSGFVTQLEHVRKYLFTAFKCTPNNGCIQITSVWITNTTIDIDKLIPEKYDDFVWQQFDHTNPNNLNKLLSLLQVSPQNDSEKITYLH